MQRSPIVLTLVLFGALTGAALWRHGYWSIFAPPFRSLNAGQILADLVIALTLVMIWMWQDAKQPVGPCGRGSSPRWHSARSDH